MDAFFASVEQRDNPELRGRPVAVGGSSGRGVVAAASYEARRYGVRSAMPSARGKKLCPDLLFVKPRFEEYKATSAKIRHIFREYTDLVEPVSLDEAYLDVSDAATDLSGAVELARTIKHKIRDETGLTASAGVSYNKFLSKMASDADKPDGLFVIGPDDAATFLAEIRIEDFHGVGRATARRMQDLGIYTGADLRARSEEELMLRFGKAGRFFYRIVRGEDHREVRTTRIRKSVGAERTFGSDLKRLADLEEKIEGIAAHVADRMAAAGVAGRTITLKIKYLDFEINTRSTTLQRDVHEADDLKAIAIRLLRHPKPRRAVRLLGLSVSNLRPIQGARAARQLSLSLD